MDKRKNTSRRRRNPNGVEIRTDKKWKQFKYGTEVPKKVLREQFDWMDDPEGNDLFFKYRNRWYNVEEFSTVSGMSALAGWDGYLSDSHFSGIVIQLSPDMDEYRVGMYLS